MLLERIFLFINSRNNAKIYAFNVATAPNPNLCLSAFYLVIFVPLAFHFRDHKTIANKSRKLFGFYRLENPGIILVKKAREDEDFLLIYSSSAYNMLCIVDSHRFERSLMNLKAAGKGQRAQTKIAF